MLSFLKIFLEKEFDSLSVGYIKKGSSFTIKSLSSSLDCLIIEDLDCEFGSAGEYIKHNGKIIIYGESRKRQFKLWVYGVLERIAALHNIVCFLKRNKYTHFIFFSCDASKRELFWGEQRHTHLIPPLFSGRERLKAWLFRSFFFFPLMPFWGVIASRISFENTIFRKIVKKLRLLGMKTELHQCFISMTGCVVLIFADSIIRIGISSMGGKRVIQNAEMLKKANKVSPEIGKKIIPHVIDSGFLNETAYSIENRLNGINGSLLIAEPKSLQKMTREAADYLIEMHSRTTQTVRVDRQFLQNYIKKPIELISAFSNIERHKQLLKQIEVFSVNALLETDIPLVFAHGDFKVENMTFQEETKVLTGLFDWDLAGEKQLPVLDLYHLLISNDILLKDVDLSKSVATKLFPLNLAEWESKILWDYYVGMDIPFQLERSLALMYWVMQVFKRIFFSPNKKNVSIWLDDVIASLGAEIDFKEMVCRGE